MSRARVWYAEDVALLMEMMQDKTLYECSLKFGVSVSVLQDMLSKARRGGFGAYPLRGVDKC